MSKFTKAYRVLKDTTIPRALYVIGETANGETLYETEGVSYSAGEYVLEENITPTVRDNISTGQFDHILSECDRSTAERVLGTKAVGTFAPEHEVEHEALVKAGHKIISKEAQLSLDAAADDASEVQAATKAANGATAHRSGPGKFDPSGDKVLTADEGQYVEAEKANPFVAKAEAKSSDDGKDAKTPAKKADQ